MSTEIVALIIAIIALIVAMATLFVTYRMYIYTKKSDKQKNKQEIDIRRKEILKRIKVKESQLKSLDDYTRFPVHIYASGNIQTQKIMLQSEIEELYKQLYE